jgi:hypothetical protein
MLSKSMLLMCWGQVTALGMAMSANSQHYLAAGMYPSHTACTKSFETELKLGVRTTMLSATLGFGAGLRVAG